MLHDIISKNPDLMNKKSELHRFQNGCIIHLEILPTTLKLSLLHNGEIDEEKPEYVYYVKPGTNDPKANAGNYQIKELTHKIWMTFQLCFVVTPHFANQPERLKESFLAKNFVDRGKIIIGKFSRFTLPPGSRHLLFLKSTVFTFSKMNFNSEYSRC